MSNEDNLIQANAADPESLAVGSTHMNANLVFLGETIETLTMPGVAVAKSDPALADALRLGTKLDCTGGGRRILDVLASGLAQQPTPPSAKRTHLKIVGGTEGPEAKAA